MNRTPAPLPPFTTLEALQREHEELKANPVKRMNKADWTAHLARVLPIRPEQSE